MPFRQYRFALEAALRDSPTSGSDSIEVFSGRHQLIGIGASKGVQAGEERSNNVWGTRGPPHNLVQ